MLGRHRRHPGAQPRRPAGGPEPCAFSSPGRSGSSGCGTGWPPPPKGWARELAPACRLVPPASKAGPEEGGADGATGDRPAEPTADGDGETSSRRGARRAQPQVTQQEHSRPANVSDDGPADGKFTAVVQLRSHADPSLVVDAADLWSSPEAVLHRLGESVETDLLLALRRGARAWAPLGRLLEAARPERLLLDDEEAFELLGPAAEHLASAGLEVLWPAELAGDVLQMQAHVETPSPEQAGQATFFLDDLLSFRWEVTLGGELLTDEEMDALAEAKRPLIRLRGRWVTVDPELLERLRHRRSLSVRMGEVLASQLR